MIKSTFLKQIRGFIDGRWVASDTGKTASVLNPANGEHLAEVPAMGREETVRAIIAAEKAFQGEATPFDKRAEWLNRIHMKLLENKKELGRIITLENGKPWKEAQAEIEYAAGFFTYAASHINILKPVTIQEKPRGCSWTIYRRPAGVVALLTP